ncbi:MAG: ArsC family reductase [Alteromonadaceae bacterium]|nr:ArsC family reductase [Alteromonadaceae bacterium]
MTTVYGIKNCDTIKKTLKWLTNNDIEHTFHDYRKDGLNADWLESVVNELGWENVLNKRGTTYRQLSDEQKSALNAETALALLIEYPAMIKRPIIQTGSDLMLGYNETVLTEKLNGN